MNKNLVVGSEGFIGKPFCAYLESMGETVMRFDIKRNVKEDARTHLFDFSDITTVYFLAWDVGGSKYLYESKLQMSQLQWNLQLMSNMFNQMEKSKTRFVFVSSQLTEETDTVYGVTKKLGEVWTDLLGGVSVRVWNAYGYMEAQDIKSHVISDFIYQALTKKRITMMTDGQEWRQFTHISDLSRAFHAAAHSSGFRKSIYDASSYEWVRIIDIAEIIAGVTGSEIIPGTKKGHDPVPAQNMGRIPGWLPQIELKDGLKTMIEEAKELLNGNASK